MKNITDYFTGPPKATEKLEEKAKDDPKIHKGSENVSLSDSEELTDVGKSNNTVSKKATSKRKRKKPKVCKSPDPVVNNVAQLLSNNLNFLSPDNSKLQKNEVISTDTNEVLSTDQEQENKELINGNISNSKVNAFQFLMDSRNKVIGTNSPGKEVEDETQENDSKKEILTARRNILKDWADKKGASKRRRIDEELDEVIHDKLNKRAKRLKKLLKGDCVDQNNIIPTTKHKRRIQRLSSSSNSVDSVEIYESIERSDVQKRKTKVDVKGCINNENAPYKENTCKENKKSIKDFNKSLKQEEIHIKEEIEPEQLSKKQVKNRLEESSNDSIIMSPKSKENKQSLLSFFGITNKINPSLKNDCSAVAASDVREVSPITKKKVAKEKKVGRKTGKLPLSKEKSTIDITDDDYPNKINQKRKKRMKREQNHIVLDDESESNQSVVFLETPQSKRKSTRTNLTETSKIAINTDESSQDGDFTPRRLRSWQMKIKIDIEEKGGETAEESSEKEKSIYVEDNSDDNEVEISSDSESDLFILEDEEQKVDKQAEKKSKKMAPIFIKAAPKPKIDPQVLEARKQFLMSGMPSSLKKSIEKQQSMEEKECVIFPTVSHVQQKCESKYWNLQKPALNIKQTSPLKMDYLSCPCDKITNRSLKADVDIEIKTEKKLDIKSIINKIKSENPDYPVYKSYRYISEKTSKSQIQKSEKKSPKKKRGRKSKNKSVAKSVEIVEPEKVETDLSEYAMWTEKYKPTSSDEIIGNTNAVKKLKIWLETWMNFSNEIISKKKRRNSDSSSEFETTDCDSRDSTRLPGNTMVLGGPCGSGKSTAVYAICYELGFNVIEINASSKRTGKRLLQELQEATQSHQVRKQNSQHFQSLFSKANKENSVSTESRSKMCVLFVEDIDIVFDQDEGFITALMQLITTSKRPIIITTTDYDSVLVQKFLSQYEHINFSPLSSYSLATWLQILCLVEGILINSSDIGILLEYNKGDVRKTLLQLQLWVQSGGDIVRNKMPISIKHTIIKSDEKFSKDDDNNMACSKTTKNSVYMHKNCIRSFEIMENDSTFYLPNRFSLGLFWWNLPNILNIKSFSKQRIEKFRNGKNNSPKTKCKRKTKYSLEEKLHLKCLTDLYDSVCFTDNYFRKVAYYDDGEPHIKNVNCFLRDSMELNERLDYYHVDIEFVQSIGNYLINGYVHEFGNEDPWLDITMPNKTETRWRAKQHICEDVFREAIPLSLQLDRKSTSLDYISCLRDISRSESQRAASNTKRGNRFRNYFRSLGINCNESTSYIANNILQDV